jgi:hypothetical protein
MSLVFDEYGHVVLLGSFSVDRVSRASRFSINIGEDFTSLQPVATYGTKTSVDHSRPRLTLRTVTRSFLYDSLLHEKKVAIEYIGTFLGDLQLETHWQSSLRGTKQSIRKLRALAQYCNEGLELFLDGSLWPPANLPEPSPDDRPLPTNWPTHFEVEAIIPWNAIGYTLGSPGYFYRVKQHLLKQT